MLTVGRPFVIYFRVLVFFCHFFRILIIRAFLLPLLFSFPKLSFEYFLVIFFGFIPAIIMPVQEPLVIAVGITAIFSFVIHPSIARGIFIYFRISDLNRFFELMNPFRRCRPYIILPKCIVPHERILLNKVSKFNRYNWQGDNDQYIVKSLHRRTGKIYHWLHFADDLLSSQ